MGWPRSDLPAASCRWTDGAVTCAADFQRTSSRADVSEIAETVPKRPPKPSAKRLQRLTICLLTLQRPPGPRAMSLKCWCRRGGLNSGPQPYQGCALPLSYGGVRRTGRGGFSEMGLERKANSPLAAPLGLRLGRRHEPRRSAVRAALRRRGATGRRSAGEPAAAQTSGSGALRSGRAARRGRHWRTFARTDMTVRRSALIGVRVDQG